MYPLSDDALPLDDLACHWARELPPRTTGDEVLNRLLKAFWLGEISFKSEGESFNQGRGNDRFAWLMILSRHNDHPGILFIAPDALRPDIETENADGSVSIDIRHRILWPPASGHDENAAAEAALQVLAEVPISSYSSVIGPILLMQKVGRAEFECFCVIQSYPLPAFWFSGRSENSPEVVERLCRKWFEGRVMAKVHDTKGGHWTEAKRKFPALSERAFKRIWKDLAPKSWKDRGRRPKIPKASNSEPA